MASDSLLIDRDANAVKGINRVRTAYILYFVTMGINSLFSTSIDITTFAPPDSLKTVRLILPYVWYVARIFLFILLIAGIILKIVGLANAMRDEPIFKMALLWHCISIASAIPRWLFKDAAEIWLLIIGYVCIGVIELLPDCYIMSGLTSICGRLQADNVEERINRYMCIYIALGFAGIVANVIDLWVSLWYLSLFFSIRYVFPVIALARARILLTARRAAP